VKKFYVKPLILLFMLILILTACSQKAETYQLTYNYEKGDKFTYEATMSGDMVVGEGQEEHGGKMNFNFLMSQEVVDIDNEGIYSINATMDDFKMSMEMDGQKMDIPNIFNQLTFEMKMDKYGKVHSIEGFDNLFNMGMQSPISMDQMMDSSKPSLPEHPVKVGDTWENSMEMPVPGVQEPIKANIVMKLEGIEEMNGQKVAKISSTTDIPLDMEYSIKDMMEGMNQPLPAPEGQEVPDVTVKMSGYEKVQSISYMTLDKGITISSEGTVEMDMTMTTSSVDQNQEVSMKMDATINMNLKE